VPPAAAKAPDDDESPPSQLMNASPLVADDSGPSGPSEAEESSFLADQGAATAATADTLSHVSPPLPAEEGSLPPLDDLVQRIPAPTRALIDELFRAKFITVKRLPREAFKS
jgi:hypothetical protein